MGLHKGSMKDQLRNFNEEIKRRSVNETKKHKLPKDWVEAFNQLKEYVNNTQSTKKKEIFIDKFTWVATTRSMF